MPCYNNSYPRLYVLFIFLFLRIQHLPSTPFSSTSSRQCPQYHPTPFKFQSSLSKTFSSFPYIHQIPQTLPSNHTSSHRETCHHISHIFKKSYTPTLTPQPYLTHKKPASLPSPNAPIYTHMQSIIPFTHKIVLLLPLQSQITAMLFCTNTKCYSYIAAFAHHIFTTTFRHLTAT